MSIAAYFIRYLVWQRWRQPRTTITATPPKTGILTVFFPGLDATMAQLARYVGPMGLPGGTRHPDAAQLVYNPWPAMPPPYEQVNLGYLAAFSLGWWQWVPGAAWLWALDHEYHTGIQNVPIQFDDVFRVNIAQQSDVQHALAATRAALAARPDARLVLFGTSRGGSVALQVAAALTAAEARRVALVVCEGAFEDSYQVMRDRFTRPGAWLVSCILPWVTEWRANRAADTRWAARAFPHAQMPVAFITSRADTIVRPERTRALYDALVLRGAKHVHWCALATSPHPGYATHNDTDRATYAAFIGGLYQQYT